jgi:hypothetical protein
MFTILSPLVQTAASPLLSVDDGEVERLPSAASTPSAISTVSTGEKIKNYIFSRRGVGALFTLCGASAILIGTGFLITESHHPAQSVRNVGSIGAIVTGFISLTVGGVMVRTESVGAAM